MRGSSLWAPGHWSTSQKIWITILILNTLIQYQSALLMIFFWMEKRFSVYGSFIFQLIMKIELPISSWGMCFTSLRQLWVCPSRIRLDNGLIYTRFMAASAYWSILMKRIKYLGVQDWTRTESMGLVLSSWKIQGTKHVWHRTEQRAWVGGSFWKKDLGVQAVLVWKACQKVIMREWTQCRKGNLFNILFAWMQKSH